MRDTPALPAIRAYGCRRHVIAAAFERKNAAERESRDAMRRDYMRHITRSQREARSKDDMIAGSFHHFLLPPCQTAWRSGAKVCRSACATLPGCRYARRHAAAAAGCLVAP